MFADVPSKELPADKVANRPVLELAVDAGLCSSKGEARRLVTAGGLYVNNERVAAPDAAIRQDQVIDGRAVVLRSGKRTFHLVRTA